MAAVPAVEMVRRGHSRQALPTALPGVRGNELTAGLAGNDAATHLVIFSHATPLVWPN